MGFPDFSIKDRPQSYLSQEEILQFLNDYTDHFNIRSLIKLNHIVKEIYPLEDEKWRVTVEDKLTKKPSVKVYDAVMLCTGHYSTPYYPDVPGRETFQGEQYHSKYYREPEPYTGKDALVIGAGPSGMDLALHLSKTANRVFFSHNNNQLKAKYPDNVTMKPLVTSMREHEVEFEDGTSCRIDVIFYCTGYIYDFPFLHESCGITIADNFIQPLYKHIIHIDKPTLCLIGIPFNVCTFQMFDLQARFYISYLRGDMKLPTPEEMRRDTQKELDEKLSKGFPRNQAHMLGPYQRSYYSDLAKLANTHDIPQVMIKIKDASFERFTEDLLNFRQDVYKIIDDENYIHVY
ncbi:pyridine nucleotide-disulfide oxidoreductase [Oryctes borbonicus]|uniref:Flavin-containing monooxygenase n=1 Tax=Oryctes borbonicus TaxID=1629725 RepID=A0A0T6BDC3_9SCAR|nr:pyridine nucleotide-disulfide oxidoreductase [Oryctes borbonicus]